ncbi:GFA family protein [Mesorhizobium sp.]|uniref:GFA family protein n=1 Tax=Mesorhizobium sp. TaxID=1871066 RepID=UPI0011F6A1B0|nr:GFA family protein [Mesorhizobium sp.]TIM15181.1 MAG: GFA family protein [Mesorhizobium sp.]TIM45281.1 MAG: GFA family protein [Mesorhizobium sp.]
MSTLYTGGCACGAVRYEAKAAPIFENHCQCHDCQKRSGTGHGSYLTFASRADVAITGTTTDWRVAADNGNVKIHSFCPVCGTPVYLTYTAMPEPITVHAASLDDPSRFNPTVVTYGIRALTWDKMETGLKMFEKMPQG